ncbi:phosphomannomutase/phosphoglucomutase [Sansalvadorimonas verongulae]|nr:phosphomannomutase/phosphoglucomutase [Sansalvadorimonas verongulae]
MGHKTRVDIFTTDLGEVDPQDTGFAVIDLARRSKNGETTVPEAAFSNNRWGLLAASPIKEGDNIIGTIVLNLPASQILESIQPIVPDSGQLQIFQAGKNSGNAVFTTGSGTSTWDKHTVTLSDLNWKVVFTPSESLQSQIVIPWWPIPAVLLLVFVIAAVLTWQAIRAVNKANQTDIRLLTILLRDIASGRHPKFTGFKQSLFRDTAQTATDLFAGKFAQQHIEDETTPDAIVTSKPAVQTKVVEGAAEEAGKKGSTAETKNNPSPDIDFPENPKEDEFASPLFQNVDDSSFDNMDSLESLDIIDQELKELDKKPSKAAEKAPKLPAALSASIFRAYDIRGIVEDNLTPEVVQLIGQAIGSYLRKSDQRKIIVGQDGRLSSPDIHDQLVKGLMAAGANVISIGAVPTPVLYFATHELDTNSGVMITGSHNPATYNGFKIVINGEVLSSESIQSLYLCIKNHDFTSGHGHEKTVDIVSQYQKRILDDIVLSRPLKLVVDCGNGIAGNIAPQLFEQLGCDVVPLYCEVDGNFPNHHPDPGQPENLQDLIAKVKETEADLGLAFDGDGDRIGLVTNTGTIIHPDRLLMLLAKDVVSRNPGSDVIFDVKCTRRLNTLISGYGGRPVMWKSGHSLIRQKMKESGALLAGELSGHIFFKERWYGFDDGIYSAARLTELLSSEACAPEEVFDAFPSSASTPEISMYVGEEKKFELVRRFASKAQFEGGSKNMLDGIRVDYPWGWGLVRASNTTPNLMFRFEADDENGLEKVKEIFRQQLSTVEPRLTFPF